MTGSFVNYNRSEAMQRMQLNSASAALFKINDAVVAKARKCGETASALALIFLFDAARVA